VSVSILTTPVTGASRNKFEWYHTSTKNGQEKKQLIQQKEIQTANKNFKCKD